MAEDSEVRCRCGRLLACRNDEGIELRCPRCKELHLWPGDGCDCDLRCRCGRLLARHHERCPVLKCPRCKRSLIVTATSTDEVLVDS